MNAVPLSPWDLALSSGLLLVVGAASLALQLGLGRRLVVAALRTVAQLSLVGLVLEWVFGNAHLGWVLAVFASMVINAGVAAAQRSEQRFSGVWSTALVSVSISATLTTFIVTDVVIGIDPWYAPRYVIPLLGMVLGNTLTGISLCLERAVSDLRQRQSEVEGLLSVGATMWEASRAVISGAIRAGMIPILNSMSVVGIVSLPGMMTGQILSGVDPLIAVRYQIMVMCMVFGSAGISTALFLTLIKNEKISTN